MQKDPTSVQVDQVGRCTVDLHAVKCRCDEHCSRRCLTCLSMCSLKAIKQKHGRCNHAYQTGLLAATEGGNASGSKTVCATLRPCHNPFAPLDAVALAAVTPGSSLPDGRVTLGLVEDTSSVDVVDCVSRLFDSVFEAIRWNSTVVV